MTDETKPPDAPDADHSKEQEIFEVRLKKAEALRAKGINPFGNGYTPANSCGEIVQRHAGHDAPKLEELAVSYDIAGRVMAMRTMGKLMFAKLRDRTGELQAMIRKNQVGDEAWAVLTEQTDVGDFVAV